MQKHNDDTIQTCGHSSLEKYTYHFIWKGSKGLLKVLLCEGWTEQNCNILIHTLMAITAFFSRSSGLLNRGARAQPLWVLVLSTASYLKLVCSNWLNLPWTELYDCSMPTFFLWASQIALIQPVHGQGYILIFLDRMHLLFTHVHFLF